MNVDFYRYQLGYSVPLANDNVSRVKEALNLR